METLIKELLHIENLEICKKIAALATLEHYKKDGTILRMGEQQGKIRFLVKGAVRFFYLDELETEHTQCFVSEPGYPVMVDAYGAPILSGCHAITDTTVLALPIEEGYQLIESSHELLVLYSQVLRRSMLFHAEIAMVLRACDAQRRYMWFRATFPEVEEYAKSRHIASFLSISPETLSRVRTKGKVAEKYHGQMRLKDDERSFDEIREAIWKDTPVDVE